VLELWIAIGLLGALAGCAAALAVAPDQLLLGGFWLVVAGLAFGVPTGLVYHVALRRSLRAAGRLPARWWLHPTALHGVLPAHDRTRVLAWCGAGALGFAATVVGCALVALGALRAA
jgi:hypothetical protein